MFKKKNSSSALAEQLTVIAKSIESNLKELEKASKPCQLDIAPLVTELNNDALKLLTAHLVEVDCSEINDISIFVIKSAFTERKHRQCDGVKVSDLAKSLCKNNPDLTEIDVSNFRFGDVRKHAGRSVLLKALAYCATGKDIDCSFINDINSIDFHLILEVARSMNLDDITSEIEGKSRQLTELVIDSVVKNDMHNAANDIGALLSVSSLVVSQLSSVIKNSSDQINVENSISKALSGQLSHDVISSSASSLITTELKRLKQTRSIIEHAKNDALESNYVIM